MIRNVHWRTFNPSDRIAWGTDAEGFDVVSREARPDPENPNHWYRPSASTQRAWANAKREPML